MPGVRLSARHLLRLTCQQSGIATRDKQRLHNLLAIEVAPSGIASFGVKVPGAAPINISVAVRDDLTRYWYFWGYTHYEFATARLVRKLLLRKRVFVDVGANVGYYALLAAAILRDRGTVHAFEPWSDVYDQLAQNIALNRFSRVRLNRLALSDRDGEANLFIPREQEWTNASLIEDFVPYDRYERVRTARFDSYCSQHAIDRVDLVKIDVEGAERRVLEGMGDLLEKWRPDIILEVLEPYAAELEQFFAGLAYRRFRIRDDGLDEIDRITGEPHDRNLFLSCTSP